MEKKTEKLIKKAISRKPYGFEQACLDGIFAAQECTPKGPHCRVEKIKFGPFFYLIFFEKKKRKIIKNAVSRKPKRFEQSYFDARFAALERALIGPQYSG